MRQMVERLLKRLHHLSWAVLVFGSLAAPSLAQTDPAVHPTPYAQRADIAEYIAQLSEQHGFQHAALQQMFAEVRQRQDIIERISKPAERVWTWARYRNHLVDEPRVEQGVAFWAAHQATLERAAQAYGVAPHYIVAILGIETRYGQVTGSFPVLDALTTLGFDYPPRAKFFRKELTEFLLLAREEGKDPRQLTGSYAGAMGYGQFIPSSYRHYAVDFDADGVRDIWRNPVDAIGSVANYFARHRWRGNGPVAVPVTLADATLASMANASLELRHTVAELQARGVQIPDSVQLQPSAKAALYKLDAADGDEYWLGLHDFYVITRYNRSHMYAMAVHQLAERIQRQRAEAVAQR